MLLIFFIFCYEAFSPQPRYTSTRIAKINQLQKHSDLLLATQHRLLLSCFALQHNSLSSTAISYQTNYIMKQAVLIFITSQVYLDCGEFAVHNGLLISKLERHRVFDEWDRCLCMLVMPAQICHRQNIFAKLCSSALNISYILILHVLQGAVICP